MATDGGQVIWHIDADTSGLDAGLKKAGSDVKSFGSAVSSNSQAQANSFKTLGAVVAGISVGIGAFFKSSLDASKQMENALTGVASVARAFGVDVKGATTAAQSLASDGLISVKDAADGLKNLLTTGFALPEAINLMNSFKDAAAFNRQGTLGFGEAIVGATQGIKNQNSIMVDNVGISKNLSNILKEQGLSVDQLGDVTSDASVRQKLYNGLLKEGAVFSGDAARAAETQGGKEAQLATAFFNLKTQIGNVLKLGYTPLLDQAKGIITTSPKLAASFVIATGAAVGFTAAVIGIVGAATLALTILGGPFTIILLAISVILGKTVFGALQKVQDQMADTTDGFSEGAAGIGKSADQQLGGKAAKAADDLREKLSDIDDQVKKSNTVFREQLAEMIKSSQDRVKSLKLDLDRELSDFIITQAQKKQSFDQQNADEVKDHGRKVTDIEGQIQDEKDSAVQAHQTRLDAAQAAYDEEAAKGARASRTKLADLSAALQAEIAESGQADEKKIAALQQRLDEENADFKESQDRKAAEYAADVQKDKEAHDQKVAATQLELDQETAVLAAHSADVASVRDFQFRDDIQKLKDSHAEQLVEFEKQKQDAIKKSKETTDGIATNYDNLLTGLTNDPKAKNAGTSIGTDIGTAIVDSIMQELGSLPGKIGNYLLNFPGKALDTIKKDTASLGSLSFSNNTGPENSFGNSIVGRFLQGLFKANGGPVRAGQGYIVGEEGPEYFKPSSSGTIIPNDALGTMAPDISGPSVGSASSSTNNYYTIKQDFTGIVAQSRSAWRDIVSDGIEAVNEDLRARGFQEIGGGNISGASNF